MTDFNSFWAEKRSSIDFKTQNHHPHYHYAGSPPQCGLCDNSKDSPRSLYNREKPNAVSGGKRITMEILDTNSEILKTEVAPKKIIEKKGTVLNKALSIFKDSILWEEGVIKRQEKLSEQIKQIESCNALRPTGYDNREILVLPDVGYVRTLSFIECLIQIEQRLNKKIYDHYDVIAASGNSAILAVCIGLGIELEDIKKFWMKEWRIAHNPSYLEKLARTGINLNPFKKKKFGYSTKKAKKILSHLLKQGDDVEIQNTFEDLKLDVYLPIIYLGKKESYAYTHVNNNDLPIIDALSSIVFDPFHFDVEEEIKGKGVSMPINDIELNVLQNNRSAVVTKLEYDIIHKNHGDLNNATERELAKPYRDMSDFMRRNDLNVHVKEFKPNRIKFQVAGVDYNIEKNSTALKAINTCIQAGKGIQPLKET